MTKNLRGYLDEIRLHDGELVEIDKPVRPHEFEATALLQQLEARKQYPAVLFNNPTDLYDKPSPFRLLSNVYATRERCAIAFGLDPSEAKRELAQTFGRRSRTTIEPEAIAPERAPVRENVWRGSEVDVGRLPIIRHFEMDMGPTLTMTHVMRSVDGNYDVSFAKTFYKWDPSEMVVSIHTRDLHRIVKEYEARGEPAPIINVLGHHPAFHHGSLARNAPGTDDYPMIGALLGEPLRLTPSVTWGDKFMVPADAEMIIEAEIPPGRTDMCDPFGEVLRIYQAQCLRPVFDVKAVTFRNRPIIQDIFSGFRDCFALNAIATEGALDGQLRARFPNLHAIHLADSGAGLTTAYVSVHGIADGQANAIGETVLARSPTLHLVVIVDDAIDVFDEADVLWAIHTYANLKSGMRVLNDELGPTSGPWRGFGPSNWGGKLLIDATRPRDFAFGARSEVPRSVIERVRLTDYLPSNWR